LDGMRILDTTIVTPVKLEFDEAKRQLRCSLPVTD
jgi:hypothetical protein